MNSKKELLTQSGRSILRLEAPGTYPAAGLDGKLHCSLSSIKHKQTLEGVWFCHHIEYI
jgi:hypothetical protein